jgi:hypothetical protein
MPEKIRTTEFIGKGCFIQGLGLLCPFIGLVAGVPGFLVGLLAGLGLLVYGSRQSVVWKCGECKDPLAAPDVRRCPVCKARFKN